MKSSIYHLGEVWQQRCKWWKLCWLWMWYQTMCFCCHNSQGQSAEGHSNTNTDRHLVFFHIMLVVLFLILVLPLFFREVLWIWIGNRPFKIPHRPWLFEKQNLTRLCMDYSKVRVCTLSLVPVWKWSFKTNETKTWGTYFRRGALEQFSFPFSHENNLPAPKLT